MVSPKLEYGEMEKLQQVVRCLRSHGGKVNSSCGMHVHVDASNHTPRSLKNALTIMYSKEDILFKALQVNPSRVEQMCIRDSLWSMLVVTKRKEKDFYGNQKHLWQDTSRIT